MPNILFVCTANICRSPVAEAVLRDRLQKRELTDWVVNSVGTWAVIQRGASHNSVLVMAEQGLDIGQHQSQMIDAQHLAAADLVLCMELGHVEALRVEFPQYADKIYLLSEMINRRFSVDDPYGQSLEAYREMAHGVTELIDGGLERIIELAAANAKKRA